MTTQAQTDRRLIYRAALFGIGAGALVLMAASLIYLVQVAQEAKAQRVLLIECTTAPELREPPLLDPAPSDCFLRARAETADRTVGAINNVVVLAAACARRPDIDTAAEIRACVEEGL